MTRLIWVTSVAVMIVSGAASGAEWTQFRGPNADGHADAAKGLPLKWSPTENIVWKQAIPGQGWSSPVILAERIYLTTAVSHDDGGYSLDVVCLYVKTGEPVWQTEVFREGGDAPKIHKKNSHASPTPIVANGRIYAHFGHQGSACLDLEGKVIWTNDSFRYAPVHGNGGSPALVGDKLIFSCDAAKDPFVLALNKNTGKEVWRTKRDTSPKRAFSFCTPLVIEVGGKTQVVLPGSDAVFAYDPDTGKAIWRVDYPGGYSVVPRPIYGHGLVYVCTGFDRPQLLAIRPDGKGDVTNSHVAWKATKGVPHTPSLLLVGDELYMVADGGIATCMDAKTGDVHWTERLGGNYSASPLFADGHIYFLSESGEAVVIEPGKTFKVLARNDLNERALASYAVGDGALFIRTAEHLWRVQAK
ncbi:MAG: PQQ-binding-like beta-propeller repeat protein [Phycisphaera sp.]|nr:PQQ-binding-like beta-propeller repeat protein [Phycisphaera sp.]